MNADAIYVRGLCLYYEDNVDKAFTHFQQVGGIHKFGRSDSEFYY